MFGATASVLELSALLSQLKMSLSRTSNISPTDFCCRSGRCWQRQQRQPGAGYAHAYARVRGPGVCQLYESCTPNHRGPVWELPPAVGGPGSAEGPGSRERQRRGFHKLLVLPREPRQRDGQGRFRQPTPGSDLPPDLGRASDHRRVQHNCHRRPAHHQLPGAAGSARQQKHEPSFPDRGATNTTSPVASWSSPAARPPSLCSDANATLSQAAPSVAQCFLGANATCSNGAAPTCPPNSLPVNGERSTSPPSPAARAPRPATPPTPHCLAPSLLPRASQAPARCSTRPSGASSPREPATAPEAAGGPTARG